jgi:cystathionine beta-lyase/cystathionine gamma-synthase
VDFETRAIHVGQEPEPATGAVTVPIYQTSTYAQEEAGVHKGYDYSRTANPTRAALEECLASLEGAAYGLAFGSGMGAITTVLHLLAPGDRVVSVNDVYGGTYRIFTRVYEPKGYRFELVPAETVNAGLEGVVDERTRMVWIESPTNPLLNIVDIRAASTAAHSAGALCVVDNTFASPYLQRPLELGADLVVHSTTKYLGGHSDVVGGFVAVSDPELAERLAFLQNALGAVPGPFDSWLVLRGLKTLALRMTRHCENAARIAEWLRDHPRVGLVRYPGLLSHPQHDLARRQMSGFGGMVSFELAGTEEDARAVVRSTRIWRLAESLGGVESLIELPAPMTHATLAESAFAIPGNLVRLSAGIESVTDLIADLAQALDATA